MRILERVQSSYFLDSVTFFDLFKRQFVMDNLKGFFETYNYLQDEKSKKVFLAFINGKLIGRPE